MRSKQRTKQLGTLQPLYDASKDDKERRMVLSLSGGTLTLEDILQGAPLSDYSVTDHLAMHATRLLAGHYTARPL